MDLREVALVFDHRVLFVLDRRGALPGVGKARLDLGHLVGQRRQPRLRTLQRGELLLRIGDLGCQPVAGDPRLFEIRLPVDLRGEPVIDVAAQVVQRAQA